MANKNLPLWENFDEEHTEFMTDFLEEAPLTLHFHFNIRQNKRAEIETSLDESKHSAKMNFSGSFLNEKGNCEVNVEENGKLDINTDYVYGDVNENIHISGASNNSFTINEETRSHSGFTSLTVRAPYANITVGFDKVNLFNLQERGIIFANLITGTNIDSSTTTFCGFHSGFNLKNMYFPFYNVMFGLFYNNCLSTYIQLNRKRNLLQPLNGQEGESIHTKTKIKAISDWKVNDYVTLSGEMECSHKHEGWTCKHALAGEFNLDSKTTLKSKLDGTGKFMMSLRHQLNDSINFGLICGVNHVPETTELPLKCSHLTYKFGARLEFSENE
jgi:hypothetical protein